MEKRKLGNTDLELTTLGFGASSMGAEFRNVDVTEALNSVRTALDCGMNLVDTSPYYGRGQSEVLLGYALQDVPRDAYHLCTKLGRYAPNHFDFSAKRVAESVDISLERMRTDHLDIVLCHDPEFVELNQLIDETIPALRKIQQQGKARYIGVSGYPMKMFREILSQVDLDLILSYNHYTLQNTMLADEVPWLQSKGVGIMNAAPFSARLLTEAELPVWHKATPDVRARCQQAADACREAGSDIAKLALQYSIQNPAFSTCITGSANPDRVAQWCEWIQEPIDQALLEEVLKILQPIHNWFYIEGLPQNNDTPKID
ncbi:MAG: aldo/keto reductase [Mariniblastus sp.]|nr:aldo/keto reductase [Mariniblastus sp.]